MKHVTKMSALYAPTLKEDPAEADLASHKLMLRSGMIRRGAAGVYSYLPLAWRTLKKIEHIICEECDAIGAQEICLPILTAAELWHKSGRWNDYGPELMRIGDRHGREFCLGPTHEETITSLVTDELKSYKQLPMNLYQIQTKFRDEIRPRFGLMRGREFIMQDGYSFHDSQESLVETYDLYREAYSNTFERCGLDFRQVAADSGQIGGSGSIEFMALADAGEASIVSCECGYAADDEAATVGIALTLCEATSMEKVETPGVCSIEELSSFLNVPANGTVKALALVDDEGNPVVCFIPGDHDLNDCKAENLFGEYHLMSDDELAQFGLVKGSIGPVALPENIRVCADLSLENAPAWICGANEAGFHFVGAQMGSDFETPEFIDIANAQEGDLCPWCGKPLTSARGIEVGQVFQLGTKYSAAMNANYMDEAGHEHPFIMGCYGIGVSRTMSAIIEQYNDENGIIWPVSVAPFEVSVLALDTKMDECMDTASQFAQQLADAGIDVVLDDRKERPGVKFADNDLMGFPFQIILGKRGINNGVAELKIRATGEREDVALDQVVERVSQLVFEGRR